MPSPPAYTSFGVSTWARALATRTGLLAALWAVLVEGRPEGLWAGGVTVPLAVGASLVLQPPGPTPVRLLGLARFLPGFLWQALAGSLDVALRAVRPVPPIHPGLLDVPLRVPALPARVFLSSVVSLVPGTLGVGLDGDCLTLHLLDARGPAREAALRHVRALERGVATLFGLEPPPGESP